jgi:acyl-ACP thioesterase
MKYTIPYTVPSSALDVRCAMSTLSLVSLAQDLAAAHYGGGGLSIPHLQQRGYTWVITKQRFVIHEYPLWLDELSVSTWAKPVHGPFCFRDFSYTYAPNGRHETLNAGLGIAAAPVGDALKAPASVLSATSAWMVLDLATGKPIKPDASFFGALEFSDDDALPTGSGFPRFVFPDVPDNTPRAVFSPTFLDIDINQHVNNLNYLRWALADTPPEVAQGRMVAEIDTYFLAQARFGDTLRAETRLVESRPDKTSIECVHRILRQDPLAGDDDTELFRARTIWRDEALLCRPVLIR